MYFYTPIFILMKNIILFLLLSSKILISCKDDTNIRLQEQQKEAKKNDAIFNTINKGWIFAINPIEPATQSKINRWMEWRTFLTEINQKPKSTIGAFQKKAAQLTKKAIELNNNIPSEFNKPQIKSRIIAVTTKIKLLDMYIHLNQIPDDKIIKIIADANLEIISLQLQMQELVRRSLIPREPGEPDFIKMKDTTRAIPNYNDPNLQAN